MKEVKTKKYLFVCEHNFTRSRHGAEFFEGYLDGKGINARVDSAGIDFISFFIGKRVNKRILRNVDRIFVMEEYMKKYIINKSGFDGRKIVVLGIKDIYGMFGKKNIEKLDEIFKKIDWKKYL